MPQQQQPPNIPKEKLPEGPREALREAQGYFLVTFHPDYGQMMFADGLSYLQYPGLCVSVGQITGKMASAMYAVQERLMAALEKAELEPNEVDGEVNDDNQPEIPFVDALDDSGADAGAATGERTGHSGQDVEVDEAGDGNDTSEVPR